MIVADSTMLADLLIGEPETQSVAMRLWQNDPDMICPGIWRYELGNLLRTHAMTRCIDQRLMEELLEAGEGLVLQTIHEMDFLEIGRLALEKEISYYDASYVWLSLSRKLKLATRDGKLRKVFPDLVLPMDD